jgi:hypothetical protein
MLFEFSANLRPALAATALVRHRIDDDPGFHGNLRLRRQLPQLDVGEGVKQPESELFADATNCCVRVMEAGRTSSGDAEALYEKNAIFSTWLMRRIGANGSLAAVTGLRTMPLAMRLEPSDISTAGAGAGAAAGGVGSG